MLKYILLIFIALWLFGFIHISFLAQPFLFFGGFSLTLQNIFFFILILFFISLLSGIFRTIAFVLLVLWLLSIFKFLLFGVVTNIILLILILVVIYSLL